MNRSEKSLLIIVFMLFTQSVFAQNWAERHFDSLGVNNYYNYRYMGGHLFTAIDRETDKYGYINRYGEIIIPFEYDWLGVPSEGLIQAYRESKGGYINLSNEVVVPFKYKQVFLFKEGVASVSKNGKRHGFIDRYENVMIPFMFDYSEGFSEGLASVRMGDKLGYINHEGEIIIPVKYDSAYDFIQGSAKVGISVGESIKYFLIDTRGEQITIMRYDWIRELMGDKYIVEKDRKYGIINTGGQEIAPCIYTAWSGNGIYDVLWLEDDRIFIDEYGNFMNSTPTE